MHSFVEMSRLKPNRLRQMMTESLDKHASYIVVTGFSSMKEPAVEFKVSSAEMSKLNMNRLRQTIIAEIRNDDAF